MQRRKSFMQNNGIVSGTEGQQNAMRRKDNSPPFAGKEKIKFSCRFFPNASSIE
jgi:hypothetical protein